MPVGCRQQRGYQWNASREEAPVRYKRKFPNIKQAKRLPRQRASSEWCVYAAVDTGGSYKPQVSLDEKTSLPATCSKSESAFKAEVPTTGIRTADTCASFHHDSPSVTKTTKTSGHRTADPTFSISNFKFPAPPSRDWIGTFGQYSNVRSQAISSLPLRQVIWILPRIQRHHRPSTIKELLSKLSIHTHRFFS